LERKSKIKGTLFLGRRGILGRSYVLLMQDPNYLPNSKRTLPSSGVTTINLARKD